MQLVSNRVTSPWMTATAVLVILTLLLTTVSAEPAQAQTPAASTELTANDERPFQLPFAEPSSLNTWMMAQPYGNTTGAYRQRFTTYGASGGIHFGVDLSAPCGTPIVALADGVVYAIDGPFGSPPHNLMIDHPDLGYASMYGHLLEVPTLKPGETVKQGQVVAYSGDPSETCYGRPHLHLEIRDLNHIQKFNPSTLIDANWDNLTLIGSSGRDFARDLTEPRKWQSLYDQPGAQTGGPIVNDFDYPWPFDWQQSSISALTPPQVIMDDIEEEPAPISVVTTPLTPLNVGRQITSGDCCTQLYWADDSTEVRFVDQPGPEAELGFWGVDITPGEPKTQLISNRLGRYSPDGKYLAYPDRLTGMTIIERLSDGESWEIDTQERSPNFTPDSQHITWTAFDDDAPRDNRQEIIWLANMDGSDAHIIFSGRRTNAMGWLSDTELLMARRVPGSSDEQLFIYNIEDSSETPVLDTAEPRDLALSRNSRYLVYQIRFETDVGENGLWLLDLQNPEDGPEKLPFFGAYRWRDGQNLIYVPYNPEASEHIFYEYNVTTGESRQLIPEGSNVVITNNEWQVSPNGDEIALLAVDSTALNGIWIIDIDQ
ncbi:MAG: peptidoglycan DD-metalloendopeptidase family protein [Anaerolineae bacterium]|nr:peptidoglycan DD-metalloendopeptidase family protein [Anaerolineae bacterium]